MSQCEEVKRLKVGKLNPNNKDKQETQIILKVIGKQLRTSMLTCSNRVIKPNTTLLISCRFIVMRLDRAKSLEYHFLIVLHRIRVNTNRMK